MKIVGNIQISILENFHVRTQYPVILFTQRRHISMWKPANQITKLVKIQTLLSSKSRNVHNDVEANNHNKVSLVHLWT